MTRRPNDTTSYSNPLIERYASTEMSYVFSPDFKFSTWRKLWIALAESERALGLAISTDQIEEMKRHIDDIDYTKAGDYEKKVRHDVMAHVHTFGDMCPKARPIIHLGATSAFVTDNTDLIQLREGMRVLVRRLTKAVEALGEFAMSHRALATLGYTHFQAAQPTTVGKRACLWLQDLCMDFDALTRFIEDLPFRGVKGTTGTQASFLNLFNGDHDKVKQLDNMVTTHMGFEQTLPVTGQTYTRKIDANAASILCGLAQSLHKFANDLRLLQNLKEIEEPFEKNQIGSSAMAYKRNPMRSERLTALSRYIVSLATSPAMTAAEQWFERTLDDSANKRLSIPQLFLAADASLVLAYDIFSGLVVYPNVIKRRIGEELPFMATENIIMEAVKKGGDRQALHERIRIHSMAAARRVKNEGKSNDLLERVLDDEMFAMSRDDLDRILDIERFVGRAPEQTSEFIETRVRPIVRKGQTYGQAGEATVSV
ncbi:MAG: adenylosuccinate lyase [Chitinivibrionales bacterium]|nr:adenylosuccinate lyase [Chitinivibrionales bacterium]MBD3357623.1 adenylosuccinate lyase [Chitinivibrionales bacterium]